MTITTTGTKTSNEIIDVSRVQAILSLGLFVNRSVRMVTQRHLVLSFKIHSQVNEGSFEF